jgi:hypothetical protein
MRKSTRPKRDAWIEYGLLAISLLAAAVFCEQLLQRFDGLTALMRYVASGIVVLLLIGIWYSLPRVLAKPLSIPTLALRQSLGLLYLVALPLAFFGNLRLVTLLAGILLLLPLLVYLAGRIAAAIAPGSLNPINWFEAVIVFAAMLALAFNFFPSLNRLVNSSIYMIKHPTASYDAKMTAIWGDYYQLMVFVRSTTPIDAMIIVPPPEVEFDNLDFWEPFVQYMVYPRSVTQEERPSVTCADMTNHQQPVAIITVRNDTSSWPSDVDPQSVHWFQAEQAGIIHCNKEARTP